MIEKAYLEITNICNLSCQFCHKTGREKRQMTEAEFEKLTDRLAGEVKYLFFHLMGEPTLHPQLPRFIKRASEKGFLPAVTTNGSLLGARGDALLNTPLYKISISLHAPAANAAFSSPEYLNNALTYGKKAAEKGTIVAFRLWNIGGEGEDTDAVKALQFLFCFFQFGDIAAGDDEVCPFFCIGGGDAVADRAAAPIREDGVARAGYDSGFTL